MEPFDGGRRPLALCAGALVVALIGGCGKGTPPAPPPADVKVASVRQEDVPIVREWIGYLDGSVNAEIRAQVSGYLVRQDYREGSAVKRGDLLFEIDARPFAAALKLAEGQLAQAAAGQGKARQDVERFTPLARDKAVSQEELDDAVQASLAADAQVTSAQANVEQAQLNLSFTHIASPIDGVAGLVKGQIGDLVGPSTGVLTTVSTLDPIKAYFQVSEQSYLEFWKLEASPHGLPTGLAFDLVLSDGSVYPLKGSYFAIDRAVDSNTGTLSVVAEFPNPQGLLRPGQYARVRAVVGTEKGALLVPRRALNELQGSYQLATVDADNHVHLVTAAVGEAVGDDVAILSGLRPGDRVVVEGIQKVKDGALVNPLPFAAAEAPK
jgi:membrane fusion protein (multidrug efflux system)